MIFLWGDQVPPRPPDQRKRTRGIAARALSLFMMEGGLSLSYLPGFCEGPRCFFYV